MAGQGSTGNVIAALASFFIPGLGQLLQGRVGMALVQFVLASLIWEPYGTLFGTVRRVLTGRTEPYNTLFGGPERTFQEGIAQFAQYIAVATGILWYAGRRRVQG